MIYKYHQSIKSLLRQISSQLDDKVNKGDIATDRNVLVTGREVEEKFINNFI
jgi:hypothetical protein